MSPKRTKPARDPYSIRDNAELNEKLCCQQIADRESKLARLLGRGFQEGDPKVERVRDQIEEAKVERQRYEDNVNEMQAIIDSGDIDDDADYRSEGKMLWEGDTDTSSSIPSEEIVTDYAVSDIEVEEDLDPSYSDEDESDTSVACDSDDSGDDNP